ncbi:uncharacterized protein LOC142635449 [Castanea sativa]|uniref:uncharacterized protein LOC142635449 n=1 Tax=Castanea sativa TaxID=21020 RepID=UPI003F64EE4D
MIYQPVRNLNPVSDPWPFAYWELDIVGPFPRAPGNQRFVLVAVDYFTKWAEAEALGNIRDVEVKRRSTGETPFSLTYTAEVITPAEVNLCSARVVGFAPNENENLMAKQLNLLEEHREAAIIRLAEYQQKLA